MKEIWALQPRSWSSARQARLRAAHTRLSRRLRFMLLRRRERLSRWSWRTGGPAFQDAGSGKSAIAMLSPTPREGNERRPTAQEAKTSKRGGDADGAVHLTQG